MDAEALVAVLQEALPGPIERAPSIDGQPTIFIAAESLDASARALRDHAGLQFAVLIELTAVDFWPREPRFEVTYLFLSVAHGSRLRVKVRLHGADAHVPTVSGIWPAANWLEREVWDLFGIAFDGHPDPRRLLMPEDWEGYPLRKDYPVQVSVRVRTTEPTQVTEEEFRANLTRDRLARQP
jgi:NADH-quinone oxidoreductase subunit C